ncbi:MAG: CapA family protein [Anaerolineae bacterium]|nr:CapA family protein [Anaerolineae bacterium]
MGFKRIGMVWGGLLLCLSGLLTMAQPACEPAGRVLRETYASAWLGQTMFYSVYLPPCYDATDQAYPVVYLLHGSNEDDGAWARLGLIAALDEGIAAGTLPEMILVMPFGNVIANRNRFDAVSWGNIFLTELLPAAEAAFRIDARREARVIAGISRGGFWAYQIGLRRPDLFSAIGGHSPFFDAFHAPPADNPLDLALSAPGVAALRLWLDRGGDDYAAPGVDLMHDRLTQRGLAHTYIVHPDGEHNNRHWSRYVGDYLAFYAAGWSGGAPRAAPPTATPAPVMGFATNTPLPPAAGPLATAVPVLNTPAAGSGALALLVPAVAFPSLYTSISLERLRSLAAGQPDAAFITTPETAALLPGLHPDIRRVPAPDVRHTLWRDPALIALLPFDALTTELRLLWVDDVPLVDRLADYPFIVPGAPPNFDPARLTRLTLSGVTALTRQTLTAIDAGGGPAWAAGGIADYVRRSDFFHISNEVSFAPGCPSLTGELLGGSSSMCSKEAHFELLSLLGVDIVELSGNHNNDYGYEAYRNTLDWYRARGMLTVGGGATVAAARQPLTLQHHGNTITLLACNVPGPYYALANDDPALLGGVRPGAAGCDAAWLEAALPAAAAAADVVIMTVQAVEYEEYLPTGEQRFQFRSLADAGADVVLGTAAHKPQTYEFYTTADQRPALVHYGAGNLFFDQPFWGNMRFFMNTLYVYEGQVLTVEIFPGIIDDLARPRLMTPEERENFLFFMFRMQNDF